MKTEVQHLRTELGKWQKAVIHSRSTIKYLEERGDVKSQRIRELESQVKKFWSVFEAKQQRKKQQTETNPMLQQFQQLAAQQENNN